MNEYLQRMGMSLILLGGNGGGHGGGNERREFGGFSFIRERGRYDAAVEMIIIIRKG
jgi:hypothetical protein